MELGVPHVIAFNFMKPILPSSFMDNVQHLPKRFDKIYSFCVEFYLYIINECTISDALEKAKHTFKDDKKKLGLCLDDPSDGPLLFPLDKNHN